MLIPRHTIAAHVAFVLAGTVTTLLGPLLPVLAARWSLDDARAGYFFTAQFAGSMLGVALSGTLVSRFGYGRGLSTGPAAMATGVGALGRGAQRPQPGVGDRRCCRTARIRMVGVWSTAAESLRAGLVIPLLGCLAMIGLHAYRARLP